MSPIRQFLQNVPRPRPAITSLIAYVPGEQPPDKGLVKLNTNEFPYPPAPEVLEAVRREAADSLRLYPNPTSAPLREALARDLEVPMDWIVAGNGSDEILRMIFQAYLGPGDKLALLQPTYSLYPVLAKMFEATVEEHPAPADGSLPLSLFATGAKVIALANPDAPLGTFRQPKAIESLAESFAGLVLIDEAYVAFGPDDCIELASNCPNVIVSRTFSKSHGMAGLRIGYAVANPKIAEPLNKIRDSYNVNRVSMAAAVAALGAKGYYDEKRNEIIATRERLRDALVARGFKVEPSACNFIFARRGSGYRLLQDLRARGILVRYFDEPGLEDGVRITIGTPEEVEKLIGAIDSMPN